MPERADYAVGTPFTTAIAAHLRDAGAGLTLKAPGDSGRIVRLLNAAEAQHTAQFDGLTLILRPNESFVLISQKRIEVSRTPVRRRAEVSA